ncbi:hypothetical protein CERSUDRAFT_97365 [Gelatoporia subvermispora B]|uniref:Uncharacterized protein n=1 Tax=Ceriporiopsis subvermispora (strain B) TaxID=914234 RepID=M2QRG7_CERS8|nr:hypothetical protein CERSUDRAFT_97365 [Gelatoporia subvermispora B]
MRARARAPASQACRTHRGRPSRSAVPITSPVSVSALPPLPPHPATTPGALHVPRAGRPPAAAAAPAPDIRVRSWRPARTLPGALRRSKPKTRNLDALGPGHEAALPPGPGQEAARNGQRWARKASREKPRARPAPTQPPASARRTARAARRASKRRCAAALRFARVVARQAGRAGRAPASPRGSAGPNICNASGAAARGLIQLCSVRACVRAASILRHGAVCVPRALYACLPAWLLAARSEVSQAPGHIVIAVIVLACSVVHTVPRRVRDTAPEPLRWPTHRETPRTAGRILSHARGPGPSW